LRRFVQAVDLSVQEDKCDHWHRNSFHAVAMVTQKGYPVANRRQVWAVRATADRSRPSFTDGLLCFLLRSESLFRGGRHLGLLQGLRAEPSLAQRLLGAALVPLATGQKQAPVAPDAPFRDAVRTLIYRQGAGGAF
jgi:hypothetical protein